MALSVYVLISFLVGFVSGLVYAYSFMLLFEEKNIPQKYKDVCITIIAMAYSCSVLTASAIGFIFDIVMGE